MKKKEEGSRRRRERTKKEREEREIYLLYDNTDYIMFEVRGDYGKKCKD